MTVKRVSQILSDGKRFYRDREFILRLAGQIFLLVSVLYVVLQRGAMPAPTPLVGVFLFSAFFWRRRWVDSFVQTHLYMAIQSVISTVVVFQDIAFTCLFMVLVGQSVAIFRTRTGLIWAAALHAIVLAVNWRHPGDEMFTPESRAVVVVAMMVVSAILSGSMAKAGRDKDRIQSLLTELSDTHARLQRYARQAEFVATAAERERIARELHDSLGHRLTVSVVQLEGADRLLELEPQRVAGMIGTVRSQLTTGLEELRQTLLSLHGHSVDRDSLLHSLRQTVDKFAEATGIACHRQLPERLPGSLSDEQCVAIYRVVQETLTNAQKHAEAVNVWVELEMGEGSLTLRVRNDGRDFDASGSSGYGLQGLRERAARLGGALCVTAAAEGGTLAVFSLPIGEGARGNVAVEPHPVPYEVERGVG